MDYEGKSFKHESTTEFTHPDGCHGHGRGFHGRHFHHFHGHPGHGCGGHGHGGLKGLFSGLTLALDS